MAGRDYRKGRRSVRDHPRTARPNAVAAIPPSFRVLAARFPPEKYDGSSSSKLVSGLLGDAANAGTMLLKLAAPGKLKPLCRDCVPFVPPQSPVIRSFKNTIKFQKPQST